MYKTADTSVTRRLQALLHLPASVGIATTTILHPCPPQAFFSISQTFFLFRSLPHFRHQSLGLLPSSRYRIKAGKESELLPKSSFSHLVPSLAESFLFLAL